MSIGQNAFNKISIWIEKNGWQGFDPYDIKGTPFFLKLQSSKQLSIKVLKKIFFLTEKYFPTILRSLFKVKPRINAKAMGLLAKGYLNLYETNNNKSVLKKAEDILDWLINNSSEEYENYCWGYPFHWQSKTLIPEGTPSVVVSSVIGDAFWKAYELTSNEKYRKISESICNFYLTSLNRIENSDNLSVCFSYTPLDNFQVHNANLFAAEFLTKVGFATNNEKYKEFGIKAGNFALLEQNKDGSLYYWSKEQNNHNSNRIDHYHSGFEIRLLWGIWLVSKDLRFKEAALRYYNFYLKNLIMEKNSLIIPKMTPQDIYPINIHSCAEGILLNSYLGVTNDDALSIASKMVPWVVKKMQKKDGSFRYMIRKTSLFNKKINISYMRWGEAWMFLALSQLLLTNSKKTKTD